jgi:hypothetical protein
MDQVTQQNAALVEEAAAAAESMQEQAQALAQAVSVFKLAQETSAVQIEKPAANVTVLRKPAPKVAAQVAGGTAARPRKMAVGSDTVAGADERQDF